MGVKVKLQQVDFKGVRLTEGGCACIERGVAISIPHLFIKLSHCYDVSLNTTSPVFERPDPCMYGTRIKLNLSVCI